MDGYELTIGKLSDQTGVKIETIRYYEKIGLMPAPPRTESGRRMYNDALADRLRFIRRGRELGFSLDDIRTLLGLEDQKPTCAEVFDITSAHVDLIRTKITDLKKLEKTLSTVAKECSRNKTPDCAIIKTLFS
ncbi:MAG: helix-turn-helix domain-containing protein [Oricola sp.]|jgi:MerR family transcriptional regulator, mercuric resistance operon regulatory protein|uniref:MerR family transcriptional regulator n=2 Tax=Hyphococcus luteus TaxID=2058213 RepID=A0A2S7K1E0_9PROT|nr:helix-turn-helix domain-containing protein [Oricola sp.]PQA86323.1 MerR family transcriptional regulator [Marinicaulis flavus]